MPRNFSQFKQLNKDLSSLYSYLDQSNQKFYTFINISEYHLQTLNVEPSLIILENFLRIITSKSYFINSIYLKEFLELENHFHDFMLFQPTLLTFIKDSYFKTEISDLFYCKEHSLLIAGYRYSDSLYGLFSSLWSDTLLGGLSIYYLETSEYGELSIKTLFLIKLPSQVNKIFYKEDYLFIGLNNGTINVYKIYFNSADDISLVKHTSVRPHSNKIIDIGVNLSSGYIYSCAYGEKTVAISEMNYNCILKNNPISLSGIINFYYDIINKKIFFTNRDSYVYIMDIVLDVVFIYIG